MTRHFLFPAMHRVKSCLTAACKSRPTKGYRPICRAIATLCLVLHVAGCGGGTAHERGAGAEVPLVLDALPPALADLAPELRRMLSRQHERRGLAPTAHAGCVVRLTIDTIESATVAGGPSALRVGASLETTCGDDWYERTHGQTTLPLPAADAGARWDGVRRAGALEALDRLIDETAAAHALRVSPPPR